MEITCPINKADKDAADNVKNGEKSKTYRREIDGLRAIAVIAVIINHFNQDLLPGGFLGVDIFFVISGYVITRSLERHQYSNLKQLLAGFYERRIKRLYPALAICLICTSIAITIVNPQPLQSLRTGLTATIGASNFYLIKNSTNYFAQSSELNPFLHTWSLAVEEQFYLIYPILFWICTRQQNPKKSLGYLPAILLILSGLSLAGAIRMQGNSPDTAYFSMPFRFWEMAAGCLLCSNLSKKLAAKAGSKLSGVFCCISVISLLALFTIPKIYIIPATILTVLFTSLFILTGESENIFKYLLSHRGSIYIGALSYSLYLWHWPIISISRWTVGVTSETVLPLTAAITLVAVTSYHCIEQPLRQKEWGKTHKNGIIKGTIAIAVTGAGIIGLSKNYSEIYKATNNVGFNQSSIETPLHWKDKDSEFADVIENCHIEDNSDLNSNRLEQCFRKHDNKLLRSAYVIGDSHAVNHYFAINKGLPEFNVGLYTAGWGCGYIPKQASKKIKKFDCAQYVPLLNKYFKAHASKGDLIFVGMKWVNKKLYGEGVRNELVSLAKSLSSKDARLIILDDVPLLPDVKLCTTRWYRPSAKNNPLCEKSIEEVDKDLIGLTMLAKNLEEEYPNVSFLRLRDYFCTYGKCSVFERGKPIYIDEGHVTPTSSARNANAIKNHTDSFHQ